VSQATATPVEPEPPLEPVSRGRSRRRPPDPSSPRLRWLLVAPSTVLLLAMTVFPLGYALFISTHTWKTTFPVKPFIGLDNYTDMVGSDDRFWNAVVKTFVIGGSALAIELIFGLIMAVVFWRTFQRVRWVATLILLPMMIAPVVVGFTARMAFTDSYGFVNQILSAVLPGDVNAQWLSDPTLAPIVIIAADAWQWGPFMFLLILAGMLSVADETIEAAVVDGARPHQVLLHIVLPSIRYILLVALILRGLDLLRMFDVIALATRGGPGTATETLAFYIYNLAFKFFDLGRAATASILMLIGVSVLVLLAVRSLLRSQARAS
jgi:multiple sugar transport system permease protein